MTPRDLEKRVETLEISQAFLERNVEQLGQTLVSQQKLVEELQRQVHFLSRKLAGRLNPDAAQALFEPDEEVPPHY